jgi:alkanesulfonate monooxygenase SsuD/methylene tetrahydromethanopterin reductase-like flavin-dependent oxidoreductase (luciferase family)
MRVGLYFDLRNPPQWHKPWADLYAQTLDWISGAEQAGADSIWLTEHHFFEDGYVSQPLTLAAAVAARTRKVRIGTAVVLAPLYPALRIAEDAAIVDLVSGGRLELGLGAGYVRREFTAYGAEREQRFATLAQRFEEIRALYGEGLVTPPPIQDPVPLWGGYLGPKGAKRAGELGVGLLTLDRKNVEIYLASHRAAGHAPGSARCAGVQNIILADDPEATFEELLPHYAHQTNSYRAALYAGSGKTPKTITLAEIRAGLDGRKSGAFQVLSVEEAVQQLSDTCKGLPVEDVFLWASIAGMPDALVERHIALTAGPLRNQLASS